MRKLIVFFFSYIIWSLLAWPFDPATGEVFWLNIFVGLFAAGFVALLFDEVFFERHSKVVNPLSYFWFLIYLPVFSYYCLLANIDVMYRAIHPSLPIKPGIVKIRTSLESNSGITALANSITLTPGTLTVDVDMENKLLYVHWINVQSTDIDEATEMIAGRFERILRRIFE